MYATTREYTERQTPGTCLTCCCRDVISCGREPEIWIGEISCVWAGADGAGVERSWRKSPTPPTAKRPTANATTNPILPAYLIYRLLGGSVGPGRFLRSGPAPPAPPIRPNPSAGRPGTGTRC